VVRGKWSPQPRVTLSHSVRIPIINTHTHTRTHTHTHTHTHVSSLNANKRCITINVTLSLLYKPRSSRRLTSPTTPPPSPWRMSARAALSSRSSPSLLVALLLSALSFLAFAQLSNKRLSLHKKPSSLSLSLSLIQKLLLSSSSGEDELYLRLETRERVQGGGGGGGGQKFNQRS